MANIHGTQSGRTSPAHCQAAEDVTIKLCSRRSQKPKFQYLHLAGGRTPEWCEGTELTSLGAYTTPNISECHSDAGESLLSRILVGGAPEKYFLSPKACQGILRRAERRGKKLPQMLQDALTAQAYPQG